MVLDLSGEEMLEPNAVNATDKSAYDGTLAKLGHEFYWLDDSIAMLRVYEVSRTIDAVVQSFASIRKDDIRIYAEGPHCLYGLLAAFLDGRVCSVEEKDGFSGFGEIVNSRYYTSHLSIQYFIPGVLKRFDLPDIRRWISQRT